MLAFGFQSSSNVYAVMEFNGEVIKRDQSSNEYQYVRERSYELAPVRVRDTWMDDCSDCGASSVNHCGGCDHMCGEGAFDGVVFKEKEGEESRPLHS